MIILLHNEARELLVEGYDRTHDVNSIAVSYGVSKWTVYHLSKQKRKTGSAALRTSQRGRKQLINDADKHRICQCINQTPDITINELQGKLVITASYPTAARIVHAMGYTVKKKSIQAS